jgi:preprotein translocase subunit SecE
MFLQQGCSSIGRATVSKTVGRGFDSLRPCHSFKDRDFMADKIKFALALVILAAGVAGFYLLSEQAMILRVLAVLVGLALAVAVAWKTEPGQRFFVFANEAVVEAKKVVWPTRKETMQTTGAVFAFVVIMAVFLYTTDKTLEWVLYDLVLGWKKS